MSARRTLALLLACLSVTALMSCSDNSSDGAKATSTTAKSATTADGSASTDVPTTLPQLPFEEGIKKIGDNIDAAGKDACALVQSLGTINVANPANPAETKEAVDVLAKFLDALADAAPAQATALHKAATDLKAEAQAGNYDVSALQNSKVMGSTEVNTALTKATSACASAG